MSVRRAASQLLSARSVHLRIVPRPSNLSESREIYRVLQRYGELDVFKWLKYEYHNPLQNIALAIYRNENAAQKALDASPIRFALEKTITTPVESVDDTPSQLEYDEQDAAEYSNDDTNTEATNHTSNPPKEHGIDDILRPSTLSTRIRPLSTPNTPSPKSPSNDSLSNMPFTPRPSPSHTTTTTVSTRWFQVIVDRSRAVHQDFVERQPFWKYYDPMKSMAQSDLAKKVPHAGLSDISKRPPNAHRTPNKVMKQMNEYFDRAMPSIRGIKENNEVERKFVERRRRRGEDVP